MGGEIERKFLLKNANWRKGPNESTKIRQGYLSSNIDRTIRVRTMGKIGIITIKGRTTNMTRKEYEYEIPFDDATELFELCEQPLIEKTRYKIVYNSKVWEVDEFEGVNQGLILAEIELNSEDEEIEIPEWIGKEVTLDPRYYNSNLAKHPYSKWNKERDD